MSAHGGCRELLAASRAYLLPVIVQAGRPQQDNVLQVLLGAIIADGISDVRLPSDPRCTGTSDQSCCMCHGDMTSAHMRGMRDLQPQLVSSNHHDIDGHQASEMLAHGLPSNGLCRTQAGKRP